MESSIPCVLVASKADLTEVKQLHGMTPAEFCYKHRLPPPLPFSSFTLDSASSRNLYTKLAWAAMFPYVIHTHSTYARNTHRISSTSTGSALSMEDIQGRLP